MSKFKKYSLLIIGIVVVAFGISLNITAAVGLGAMDAITQSISFLTGVKVGTIGFIFNSLFILGQFLLLKKAFTFKTFLQLPVSVLLGVLINFFVYTVLAPLAIEHYLLRLSLLIMGTTVLAFAVAVVMVLDIVTLPLEALSMVIAERLSKPFGFIRQLADIICILLVVILTLVFNSPLTLREGTIIAMLLFGPLSGFFIEKLRPLVSTKQTNPVNS